MRRNATVGELLEAWFEMAALDFSPSTVKETRGFIDRNLLPTLGAVPLTKLRASELDAFYRRLQASGGSGGRPLSPATVRRIHGILRRALGPIARLRYFFPARNCRSVWSTGLVSHGIVQR